jgi:penicillin-binding protein 1A
VWIGYDQPRTIIGRGYASVLAVPLWGRFMAAATRKDTPEWFDQPQTITTATICRLSGKLATDGCREAVIADGSGNVTRGSAVHSEYFVRGTEPTEACPLHQRILASPLRALASLLGPSKPSSQSVSSQPPPERVTDAAPPPKAAETAPAPQQKRSIWSRIFGGNKK